MFDYFYPAILAAIIHGTSPALPPVSSDDIYAPILVTQQEIFIEQGRAYVMDIHAIDRSEVTYSIPLSKHRKLFTIDAASGVLQFKETPDYIYDNDPDTQETLNSYKLTVQMSDSAGNSSRKTIRISVEEQADAEAPDIRRPDSHIRQVEKERFVTRLNAMDEQGLHFSLSGNDAQLFEINPYTAELFFKEPPLYLEGGTNHYVVEVNVSDLQGNTAIQQIEIDLFRSGYLQRDSLRLSPQVIDTISCSVSDIQPTTLDPSQFFGAWDIHIQDGGTTLVNGSYRQLDELLVKDMAGRFHALHFSPTVPAHSVVRLDLNEQFDVVQSVGFFNTRFRYQDQSELKSCDVVETGPCYVALTEEQIDIFSTILSQFHDYFNSRESMIHFKTWMRNEVHPDLLFSYSSTACIGCKSDGGMSRFSECSGADDRSGYAYRSFFRDMTPAHRIALRAVITTMGGYGSGKNPQWYAERDRDGKASIAEHAIYLEENGKLRIHNYRTLHHEMMHGFAFGHFSGMTYGYSDVLPNMMHHDPQRDMGTKAQSSLPQYLFSTSMLADNQLKIDLFSHVTSGMKAIDVELFSPLPFDYDVSASTDGRSVLLNLNEPPLIRFFVRIYDDSSSQVMSRLIYPSERLSQTTVYETEAKRYHVISNANYQKLVADANEKDLSMLAKDAYVACLGWSKNSLGLADATDMATLSSTLLDTPWIDSKSFLGAERIRYDIAPDGTVSTETVGKKDMLDDGSTNLVCVEKLTE